MKLPPQAATVARRANPLPASPPVERGANTARTAVAPSSGCNPPQWYFCFCPKTQIYTCCPADAPCSDVTGPCLCGGV